MKRVAILLFLFSATIYFGQNLKEARIKSHVQYVSGELKRYPVPPVVFERAGLSTERDRNEIRDDIIYPAINKSERPVAAFIVEFYPDKPSIGVTIVWMERAGEGNFAAALIPRNTAGHFDQDAWKALFPGE